MAEYKLSFSRFLLDISYLFRVVSRTYLTLVNLSLSWLSLSRLAQTPSTIVKIKDLAILKGVPIIIRAPY